MSALTLPYSATANQVAPSASYNANNAAIVTWSTTIDHSNTVNSTGFYAADLKPLTAAEATFGATATGVGYKFLANDATAVPLTVSGVSGQTADLFDVTLTSGGTKAFSISSVGTAAFSGALTVGSSLQTQTLTCTSTASFQAAAAFSGALTVGNGYTGGGNGSISSALTSSSGQVVFGGSGASATGAGAITFSTTTYNFFSASLLGSTANIVASTGVYTATSDARLKENIVDIPLGLTEVLQLRPVSFDWISTKEPGQGFLAQDVQRVVPRAVSVADKKKGMLGVSDALLTPVIVRAIQELAARVTALERV